MRRFADLSEQRAVALVARPIVAGAAAGLEHRLEVVQDQQAAGVAQQLQQPSDLSGLAPRLGLGSFGARNPIASASHSPGVGASRRLRQKTRSNDGATSWARRVASSDLPIPPSPSTATTRHRSSSTHCVSSARSDARPEEAGDVRRFAPGLSSGTPRVSLSVAKAVQRRCSRRRPDVVRQRSRSNQAPSKGVRNAWRVAQGGRPKRLRLLALASGGEATGLHARRDERLQARHAGVVGARLPSLDRA